MSKDCPPAALWDFRDRLSDTHHQAFEKRPIKQVIHQHKPPLFCLRKGSGEYDAVNVGPEMQQAAEHHPNIPRCGPGVLQGAHARFCLDLYSLGFILYMGTQINIIYIPSAPGVLGGTLVRSIYGMEQLPCKFKWNNPFSRSRLSAAAARGQSSLRGVAGEPSEEQRKTPRAHRQAYPQFGRLLTASCSQITGKGGPFGHSASPQHPSRLRVGRSQVQHRGS